MLSPNDAKEGRCGGGGSPSPRNNHPPSGDKSGEKSPLLHQHGEKSEAFATRFLHADEADGEKDNPVHNLYSGRPAATYGKRR